MRIFHLSVAVMALLSISIAGHAQVVEPAKSPQPNEAAAAAPAQPQMPDVILFESNIGNIHFPHTRHQKMSCKRCHHQIHARDLKTPHKEYFEASWIKCQTCHDTDSKIVANYYKCSGCHHQEPESIVDETISSKVVLHQSCWKCHKSGTGVKASEGCSYCHIEEE